MRNTLQETRHYFLHQGYLWFWWFAMSLTHDLIIYDSVTQLWKLRRLLTDQFDEQGDISCHQISLQNFSPNLEYSSGLVSVPGLSILEEESADNGLSRQLQNTLKDSYRQFWFVRLMWIMLSSRLNGSRELDMCCWGLVCWYPFTLIAPCNLMHQTSCHQINLHTRILIRNQSFKWLLRLQATGSHVSRLLCTR